MDILMNLFFSVVASLFGASMQGVFFLVTSVFASQENWTVASFLFGTVSLTTLVANCLPFAPRANRYAGNGGIVSFITRNLWAVVAVIFLVWLRWPITSSFMAVLSGLQVCVFGMPQELGWMLGLQVALTWIFSVTLARQISRTITHYVNKVTDWVAEVSFAVLLAIAYAPFWAAGQGLQDAFTVTVWFLRATYAALCTLFKATDTDEEYEAYIDNVDNADDHHQGYEQVSFLAKLAGFFTVPRRFSPEDDDVDDTHLGEHHQSSFHCTVEEYEGTMLPTYDPMPLSTTVPAPLRRSTRRSAGSPCNYNENWLSKQNIDYSVQW
jgi:hypothetical protein